MQLQPPGPILYAVSPPSLFYLGCTIQHFLTHIYDYEVYESYEADEAYDYEALNAATAPWSNSLCSLSVSF